MKRITTWKPDTCECIIELGWDDVISEEQRTHELERCVFKCSAHQNIPDQEILDTVLVKENQQKNQAITIAMEVTGISPKQVVEEKAISFSFDEERNLILNIKGLDTKDKEDIVGRLPGGIKIRAT